LRPRLLVDREPIGHDHPTDPAPPFWLSTVAADVTTRRDDARSQLTPVETDRIRRLLTRDLDPA